MRDLSVQHRTHFSIVRLPLFLENYYGFERSVKEHAAIRCCIDPTRPYTPIAVNDVGEALAAVAADRERRWEDRTITLAGEPHTLAQVSPAAPRLNSTQLNSAQLN